MVEILLSRPEPQYNTQPAGKLVMEPAAELEQHLKPLRDFLTRQPKVRAAWIYRQKPAMPSPADSPVYEIGLLIDDPEDKSLLPEVGVMARALTPVEMECVPTLLMADDQSLRSDLIDTVAGGVGKHTPASEQVLGYRTHVTGGSHHAKKTPAPAPTPTP